MKKALKLAQAAAKSLLAFAVSAVLWIILLFLGGIVAMVAGMHLLFGPGPALIVAGIAMLCGSLLLKRAVTHG